METNLPGLARSRDWVLKAVVLVGMSLELVSGCVRARPASELSPTLAWAISIQSLVDQEKFSSARWGIQVASLNTGKILFEHNSQKFFVPASNTKLFTAALALDQLGASHQIHTSVYAREGPDRRGRIDGDLVLYGRGDPTFIARPVDGVSGASIPRLAGSLAATGTRLVRGNLQIEDGFFRGSEFGSGWSVDDLDFYYSPEVSALSFNENVAEWIVSPSIHSNELARVDFFPSDSALVLHHQILTVPPGLRTELSATRELGGYQVFAQGQVALDSPPVTNLITVRHPSLWFGRQLGRELKQSGVRIMGGITAPGPSHAGQPVWSTNGWMELAREDSPPLSELVRRMMKPSNNLYAQLLLLQVGANSRWAATASTTEQAADLAMELFLKRAIRNSPLPILEEGSGLSRRHGVTPGSVVDLLRFMAQHPESKAFRESLPVAGMDGTLRTRMRGTSAEGKLAGKTGTLRGVNALSGYLQTRTGEPLVFSIFLNDYFPTSGQRSARDEVDAVAVMLSDG